MWTHRLWNRKWSANKMGSNRENPDRDRAFNVKQEWKILHQLNEEEEEEENHYYYNKQHIEFKKKKKTLHTTLAI